MRKINNHIGVRRTGCEEAIVVMLISPNNFTLGPKKYQILQKFEKLKKGLAFFGKTLYNHFCSRGVAQFG